MGQDLRQLLPAYVRQEFDDMDIFLASTAKSICSFLAWLDIFFWQGSRYFV